MNGISADDGLVGSQVFDSVLSAHLLSKGCDLWTLQESPFFFNPDLDSISVTSLQEAELPAMLLHFL